MKIKSVLLAVGVAIAGLAGFTGTASAAPCTYDHVCLWSNAGFTGYKYDTFYSQPNWGNLRYAGTSIPLYRGDGVATNVSSLDNWDPDSTVAVYYNSLYRGPCFTVAAYGSASDFTRVRLTDGTVANDRMNSHHFNRLCGQVYNF